jgi:hypothetical protein
MKELRISDFGLRILFWREKHSLAARNLRYPFEGS